MKGLNIPYGNETSAIYRAQIENSQNIAGFPGYVN